MIRLIDLLRVLAPTDDVRIRIWRNPDIDLPVMQSEQMLETLDIPGEVMEGSVLMVSPINWHTVAVMILPKGEVKR